MPRQTKSKTKKKPAPLIRWSAGLRKLKAISIRQPWAWLIVNGYKDIENRIWATHVRGTVLIHAGQNKQDLTEEWLNHIEKKYGVRVPESLDLGGIVGLVDIEGCVQRHPSKWFNGPFGWVLDKPRRLPFKPCKGQLKFFTPVLVD